MDLNPLKILSQAHKPTNKATRLNHLTKEFWLRLLQPKTQANKLLKRETKPRTTWNELSTLKVIYPINNSPYKNPTKSNSQTLKNPRSSSLSFKSTTNTLSKINKIPNSPPTSNPPLPTKKPSKHIPGPKNPTEPKSPTNPKLLPKTKNLPVTIATCPTSSKSTPSKNYTISTTLSSKSPSKMPRKSRKSASRKEEEPKRLNPPYLKNKSLTERPENHQPKKENHKMNPKAQPKRPLTSTQKTIRTTKRANLDKIEFLNVLKMKTTFENLKKQKLVIEKTWSFIL